MIRDIVLNQKRELEQRMHEKFGIKGSIDFIPAWKWMLVK